MFNQYSENMNNCIILMLLSFDCVLLSHGGFFVDEHKEHKFLFSICVVCVHILCPIYAYGA